MYSNEPQKDNESDDQYFLLEHSTHSTVCPPCQFLYDYSLHVFTLHARCSYIRELLSKETFECEHFCGKVWCDMLTKYIYTKSTTVSVPSSELGPPPPLPQTSVSPRNQGGTHSPAGEGVPIQTTWGDTLACGRGVPIQTTFWWRKSLVLCLPCGYTQQLC